MVEITAFNEVSVALWELCQALIVINEGLYNIEATLLSN